MSANNKIRTENNVPPPRKTKTNNSVDYILLKVEALPAFYHALWNHSEKAEREA